MAVKVSSGWTFETGAEAGRTMRRMSDHVRGALNGNADVVRFANVVAAPLLPYANQRAVVRRIREWFRNVFSFVNDPVGRELLRPPVSLIADAQAVGTVIGDCDEAAMLAATLGMANGLPARFRALAFDFDDAPFTHVVTDLFADGAWLCVDPTKPPNMRPGRRATREFVVPVSPV